MSTRILLKCLFLVLFFIAPTIAQEDDDGEQSFDYEVVAQLGTGQINHAAFSPDSRQLAVATDAGIRIYDLDGETATATLRVVDVNSEDKTPYNTSAEFVAYTEDGENLIYVEVQRGQDEHEVYVWQADAENLESTEIIASIIARGLHRIIYEPSENIIAISERIEERVIIEIQTGHVTRDSQIARDLGEFREIASPDGNWEWIYLNEHPDFEYFRVGGYEIKYLDKIVVNSFDNATGFSFGDPPRILRWDTNEIKVQQHELAGFGVVWDIAKGAYTEIPDGGWYASAPHYCEYFLPPGYCVFPAYEDDNNILVSYDSYYTEQPSDVDPWEVLAVAEGHTDRVISLHACHSGLLLSGSDDNTAIVWDVDSDADHVEIDMRFQLQHAAPVTYVGCARNLTILTSSDGNLYFWDRSSGDLLHEITRNDAPIHQISWQSENRFATANRNTVVLIWELVD